MGIGVEGLGSLKGVWCHNRGVHRDVAASKI